MMGLFDGLMGNATEANHKEITKQLADVSGHIGFLFI